MKSSKHGSNFTSFYKIGLLILVFAVMFVFSANRAMTQKFYPINQPKIDDKIFHVPLTVNIGSVSPDPYDPLKQVYNPVCIYNDSGILKITTDLSFSRDVKLDRKKGFIVITYPVKVDTSPSNPAKPKVLSHAAIFTPKVESINGIYLDSKKEVPSDQIPAFKEKVKQLGIPLGKNQYAFNLYGAKGEINFSISDKGEMVAAELVSLSKDESHFDLKEGGYRTSDGKYLPPMIITIW